jgi:subtilisin family serine protease
MSYRVFYSSIHEGDGSAYDAELIAAIEDAVADGADVINNSWGVGPYSAGGEFDAMDQALINAVSAGVFISMAAGNSGPGKGTADHPSENYISVASSSTDGTFAAGRLNITAPEPVPDSLQGINYDTARFGTLLETGQSQAYSGEFTTAMSIDESNFEGCDPWPEETFAGKTAMISRGSCEFGTKALYAENAGAEFVIIYNHEDGGDFLMSMSAGSDGDQVTIPSIFIGHSDGLALVDWHTNAAAQGEAALLEVNTFAYQAGNTPDVIADFSCRGPGVGNTLKPDITAPGVNILSQGYTPGASGEDRHLGYGQVSGTSMAAPHVAGAAALLIHIHPDWSPAYIKSALMTTSRYLEIYTHDGLPAQPLDMGAGRLDFTKAADPGVILAPPSVSFGAVSLGSVNSSTITVSSVADQTETYAISTLYTGNGFDNTTAMSGITVTPNR